MAWSAALVQPAALAGLAVAATLIAAAVAIALFLRGRCDVTSETRRLARMVSIVLIAGAATELTGVATLWQPVYGLHIVMKALFVGVTLGAMAVAWRILPGVLAMPSRAALADANHRLETLNAELEVRVEARTRELAEAKERFEAALSGSRISVATQDRDLHYRWIHNPPLGLAPEAMMGRTDDDILDAAAAAHMRTVKFGVINAGQPASTEIETQDRQRGRVWLRVHVTPYCPGGRAPEGVTLVVVDITDERRRAEMLEHVTQALAEANARFDTALAGSNITMFRQDRDLRYTWMHNPPLGMTAEDFLGRDDEAALPEATARVVIPLKRRVLETAEPERAEVSIKIGDGLHWFDLRIEPFHERGRIAGVMCVAIDITGQKEYQQQLKVVMRELTHRSKNLLAVVQGIARQTAQTVDDMPAFVDRFGARLQALARAHDILVDESWRGASIDELVSSQLGHVMETSGDRLDEGGTRVMLKPEAAQNVALALHELATNAAKYGALSTAEGRIAVHWGVRASETAGDGGQVFEITWQEQGGPPVEEPRRKGFGRMMIERLVPRAIDGTSELVFDPEGIRWTLRFPTDYLTDDGKGSIAVRS
ncbi:sensor histidine kinase [Prosthecomicrobium hirschii]|nr:HWE histidine kinase domain-containing protein [Prosthecomicrobium hirschii]